MNGTPDYNWLVVVDGEVDLRLRKSGLVPGRDEALRVGLQAAGALGDARPGPALLDWLESLGTESAEWDPAARLLLVELLRGGNARSWRFLEATGLLALALPELADVVLARRAEPNEPDSAHPLRFDLVDRSHALLAADQTGSGPLPKPERLILAALLSEVGADVATARQVVRRLDLGDKAEEDVAVLVGESGLLRAAAARHDGLDEEHVLPIASHLERSERARALYLLSLALGPLSKAQRHRLDQLHDLVQMALMRQELTSIEVRTLAQQRRIAATKIVGEDSAAADRLVHAPQAWLLAHDPEALARMATLVEPLPEAAEVRIEVLAAGPDRWRLEIACRDHSGLLASLTAALAGADYDVVNASLASWLDGGVADMFLVATPSTPEPDDVIGRIAEAGRLALAAPPVAEAVVTFDAEASPWHTICQVEAVDRPGLLHTLAVAFTASGANVHAARITTADGTARDRFHLTDSEGAKLRAADEEAIRSAVLSGVKPPGEGE